MRVYNPLNSIMTVRKPKIRSEFEIHAELYSLLKNDSFDVFGNVTLNLGKTAFDLVIFNQQGEANAIIEVKREDEGKRIHLDQTLQGLKYQQFGVPVILFWDLSRYQELKFFLCNNQNKNLYSKKDNSGNEDFIQASKSEMIRRLKLLRSKLGSASCVVYDLKNTSLKQDIEKIEQLLEEATVKVQALYERV